MSRALLIACGWLFVGLAAVGVALPLIPTTPFVIVAAACFARSSPRFHGWLLGNRIFGPFLRTWAATHSVPRRAKILAVLLITAVGTGTAVYALETLWSRALLAALLLAVMLWLLSRPTTEDLPP
ncbi:MAG: YbaN family protein [Planctomycetota bacterium]